MKTQQADIKKDDYAKVYAVYFPRLVRFSQTYVMSRHDAEIETLIRIKLERQNQLEK